MAGETIFIQPILKETLDGIDQSLDGMSEDMQAVVSGLEDLKGSGNKTLSDVVASLVANQEATALLLANVSAKLDSQIAELQSVVTATTNNVPLVRVKPGESVATHLSETFNFVPGSTMCNMIPFCTGIVKFKLSYRSSAATTFSIVNLAGQTIFSTNWLSYSVDKTIEFNLPINASELLKFNTTGNATGYIRIESIKFDYADITQPDDIIEVRAI